MAGPLEVGRNLYVLIVAKMLRKGKGFDIIAVPFCLRRYWSSTGGSLPPQVIFWFVYRKIYFLTEVKTLMAKFSEVGG